MGMITNPEEFEQKLRQAQVREATTLQPKQRELDRIQALLQDTEKEADEIAQATLKAKGIIAKKLERQGAEINKWYQALTARQAELQEALALELTDGTINDLLLFRETVATGLQSPTFEAKQQWLEILQVTVPVENQLAAISCRLGGKPLQYRLIGVNNSEFSCIIKEI